MKTLTNKEDISQKQQGITNLQKDINLLKLKKHDAPYMKDVLGKLKDEIIRGFTFIINTCKTNQSSLETNQSSLEMCGKIDAVELQRLENNLKDFSANNFSNILNMSETDKKIWWDKTFEYLKIYHSFEKSRISKELDDLRKQNKQNEVVDKTFEHNKHFTQLNNLNHIENKGYRNKYLKYKNKYLKLKNKI